MDTASRPPVPPPPHRPSGWTWLPGLQMGGRAPHLWWTLDPDTLTPQTPAATYPVLTIIPDWIQVAFPAAIITDSWSILGHYHRTLPQTECQHASPGWGVCVCVCDHWGGKELRPGSYAEEPQKGEPFERSLNPGGLQVWLAVLLSMLGHNLKGDQRAIPQSSKALFLPPHLCLSLSLSRHSQPAHPLYTFTLYISLTSLDQNYTTGAQITRNRWRHIIKIIFNA